MRARIDEIVFDCHDPALLVRFWAALLGGAPVDRDSGWSFVDPPGSVRVAFQQVPEGKAAKNRLHLDLAAGDVEAASDEAVALGAVRLGGVVADPQGRFQVLADPEGNEFCFVQGGGE
ncbi:VOC family protein [Streptomyces sp. NPDC059076]|uniref:VOC family protein n=1 Tax=unclassified Streptomyces TaxID=2593676 RepID=UPI0036980E22